ncbi:ribonuclease T2 [Sphingomonas sp. ID0503]|uniref:ribonuclease T2 n=1 Tax=Sphingomonas sp. ID0503 TaxID=3399691 RepID=UPI003AFB5A15
MADPSVSIWKPVTGAFVALLPITAVAAPVCAVPARVIPAPETAPPPGEIVRDAPTTHYVLAMTWSPEWCRTHADNPDSRFECHDNRFGLILHGLWPSNADGRHPRYCGPAPALSPGLVRRMLCTTPSAKLLQHEWAAHGTCGWDSAARYFGQATTLWQRLRRPEFREDMTAGAIRDRFVALNPALPRKGVHIRVASGNRLDEIFICYDLKFRPRGCPMGPGTPDGVRIRVEPVAPKG